MGVMTAAIGLTTFVASSRPPIPTSSTATLALRAGEGEEGEEGQRLEVRRSDVGAVAASLQRVDDSSSSVGVDRRAGDRPALADDRRDAARCRGRCGTRWRARIDVEHRRGRALAVRAGDDDGGDGALRIAERAQQRRACGRGRAGCRCPAANRARRGSCSRATAQPLTCP